MQEKLAVLWQFLEPRLRVVMVLLFLALLGLIFFLKSTEGLGVWTPPWTAAPKAAPTPGMTPGLDGTVPGAPAAPTPGPDGTVPLVPAAVATPNLADTLKNEDRKAAENVGKVLYAPQPVEKTPYVNLIVHSMFSIRQVQDQAGREQVIRDLYNEAMKLYTERKYPAALAKCNEILAIRANHIEAQNLKQRLQTEMGGTVR